MKLIKCPRCELNYMYENETMCSVCRKDVKGEQESDEIIELCSECGENPVIPGQEVCAFCLKEMQRRTEASANDDGVNDPTARDLDIDSVSSMDEIEMSVDDADEDVFTDDEDFEDEDGEEDDEDSGDSV
ncbi:MAG: hypothetical protein IKR85_04625 [Clostridia bacterium]|nr:hypothetical protein [Clostridia bacterium]